VVWVRLTFETERKAGGDALTGRQWKKKKQLKDKEKTQRCVPPLRLHGAEIVEKRGERRRLKIRCQVSNKEKSTPGKETDLISEKGIRDSGGGELKRSEMQPCVKKYGLQRSGGRLKQGVLSQK